MNTVDVNGKCALLNGSDETGALPREVGDKKKLYYHQHYIRGILTGQAEQALLEGGIISM